MSLKIVIKKKIFSSNGRFAETLQSMYRSASLTKFRLLNSKWREKKKSFGKRNPDKVFYVIRRKPEDGGLFSCMNYVFYRALEAEKRGMLPVVDMESYPVSFKDTNLVRETPNAWEYFFEQLTDVSLKEVYESKNVILSDQFWPHDHLMADHFNGVFLENNTNLLRDVCERFNHYVRFNAQTALYLEKACRLMRKGEKVLAVMSRGTDYTALRPRGHHVQPDPEYLILTTQKIMDEMDIEYCYLNTEEESVLEKFKKKLGDQLLFCPATYYDDYNERIPATAGDRSIDYYPNRQLFIGDFIRSQSGSLYARTREYLRNVYIASKCDYLLCGLNSGTLGAIYLNNFKYEKKFIYDVGLY